MKAPLNTPYTSPITHALRARTRRFRLKKENYIHNFQTALADAVFQLAEDPLLVWACHDALHNRWMFSRHEPTRHTWGRWRARGTKYYVLSTLPQLPHPITQHSPLWHRTNGIWHLVKPAYVQHNPGRATRSTDPYVLNRLKEIAHGHPTHQPQGGE